MEIMLEIHEKYKNTWHNHENAIFQTLSGNSREME